MDIDSSLYFISFVKMSEEHSAGPFIIATNPLPMARVCQRTFFLMNSQSDFLQTGYLGSQETERPLISHGKSFSYKIKITTFKVKFYNDPLHFLFIFISYDKRDNNLSLIFAIVKCVTIFKHFSVQIERQSELVKTLHYRLFSGKCT